MSERATFGSTKTLHVTIVVDNLADGLARSTDGVRRHEGGPLIAEHGFCALIDLPGADRRILWDAGASETTALENLRRLRIDPGTIDTIAVSHGHWDHVGGMAAILRAARPRPQAKSFPADASERALIKHAMPNTIPVLAHPAAYRERWKLLDDGRRTGPIQAARAAEWEALGAQLIDTDTPVRIADGCWITGYVPRESFETAGRPTGLLHRQGDRFLADDLDDDQSLAIHVEGKGLVIVAGCAHAGIVNTVRYARTISGVERVHAILGGFHLGRADEETIERTIDALAELEPTCVVPSHCTGFAATRRFAERLPEAFVLNAVGTCYAF